LRACAGGWGSGYLCPSPP